MQFIIVMSQKALCIGTLVVMLKILMSSLAVETYNTDVASSYYIISSSYTHPYSYTYRNILHIYF